MRLPAYAAETGVRFTWRPFNVRTIMVEQKNIPFAEKPVKAAYMWRDIERRAARYGLHVAVPAPYPLEHLALANQVALVGAREGWAPEYVVETYRLWFQDGQPSGSEPNMSESLKRAWNKDSVRVIELARSEGNRTGARTGNRDSEVPRCVRRADLRG